MRSITSAAKTPNLSGDRRPLNLLHGIVNAHDVAHRLFRVEIVVVAARTQELAVRSLLDDLAFLDDKDAIGGTDG